ncbi:GntR family transcriptional regulator [Gordonia sp. HY285]|uniref:GntR family transcriptional regulator n=1 Tax=Gordonia liuliyuniae TaxID=2911517 RepID=UPI001F1B1D6B|nr:GntR family transcriptional regulator [Gordonia liuliyuniae]MCF8612146.1 GntR family transcriptional regulator [Gordonia liuliyuniae]
MSTSGPARQQLTDEVADRLRWKIMTGELAPGGFIRLDEAAVEFGCSVTPVREALVALRSEGLVRSYAHRGFAVAALSRRDIVDIFWMQAELSARMAMRVPENSTLTTALPRLNEIVDRLEVAVDAGNARAISATEREFHRAIYRLADSPKAAWLLGSMARYSPFELYADDPEWGRLTVAGHRRLIAMIGDDDKPGIHAEVRAAYTDARDRLIARLDASGFWQD